MNCSKFTRLGASVLLAVASQSMAWAQSFDEASRLLILPFVQVGNLVIPNVVVRLDNFSVLSAAPALPLAPVVSDLCTGPNFTLQRYDAISVGMTLNQVRGLIGCAQSSNFSSNGNEAVRRIRWVEVGSTKDIEVYFDANNLTVLANGDPSGRVAFKSKNIL